MSEIVVGRVIGVCHVIEVYRVIMLVLVVWLASVVLFV